MFPHQLLPECSGKSPGLELLAVHLARHELGVLHDEANLQRGAERCC